MTLDKLPIGQDAEIVSVNCKEKALRKHILEMGLTPNTEVTMIKAAPLGDPIEIRTRGYLLTLRLSDAANIEITNKHNAHEFIPNSTTMEIPHPGVGENYNKARKQVIDDSDLMNFALVGNQNCGKTTLFNQLTGSNQHVGNFPGVTVDRKDGTILGHDNVSITDLPGIYSMSPYSKEEVVSREFVLNTKPDCIVNIIDATNIERNLYLTIQLIELQMPMVIALNYMDEVRNNGGTININAFENILGVPVVPISASKGEGINELIEHAITVAKFRELPKRLDFCDENGPDKGAVHRCIHSVAHLITDHCERSKLPERFCATKLIEEDELVLSKLNLDENEVHALDHLVEQMEEESKQDRVAAIADMRFRFINFLCENNVVKPVESKESKRSAKIDKVLTGKFTAIPSFVLIIALVFYLTFGLIGSYLSNILSIGINLFTNFVDKELTIYGLNHVVHSFLIDGIFAGVGSVLSFLPIIVTLFFFLSILEDTGYMARIAFVMDKLLRHIGLSGRSFVPMLVGFGCSVPAIMATRTLPSDRDRKMTILLTPFMSCSAKLPIYALFSAAFFPNHAALVMILLYFLGIILAILYALFLKTFIFKGEPVPFVMELPNYRFPSFKNVIQLMWEKAKDFLTKAFTVIFIASCIIWFLQTFDTRLNVVNDSSLSLLALIGGLIAPIFTPLGLGDWKIATSLVTGFMAKESVVSTLIVLLGGNASLVASLFTTKTAVAFLVFSLIYTPCVAAIASVKRELGKIGVFTVVFGQCVIAYITSLIVYNIINIIW